MDRDVITIGNLLIGHAACHGNQNFVLPIGKFVVFRNAGMFIAAFDRLAQFADDLRGFIVKMNRTVVLPKCFIVDQSGQHSHEHSFVQAGNYPAHGCPFLVIEQAGID